MSYLNNFLRTFLEQYSLMVPYLAFGLLVAGILKVFVKSSTILNHLGGNSIGSVIKAVIIGVPLPLCSCSVVPTAMSLKSRGASKGSIIAFLIATPQTGVESIAATYGMMGPLFAFFRPFAALVTGILGGIVATKVRTTSINSDETIPKDKKYPGIINKLKEMVKYGFVELMDDIGLNLLVGIIISAAITIFIPSSFFLFFRERPVLEMFAILLGAVPLYVCATASIPIAAALVFKGISPGAAFLFLLAGPGTNAATITVIFTKLGRVLGSIYLSTIIIGSFVFGTFLNWFYSFLGINPTDSFMQMDHSMESLSPIMIIGIILFTIALLNSIWRSYIKVPLILLFRRITRKSNSNSYSTREFLVSGMTCNNCVKHVKNNLEILGLSSVSVDLDSGFVSVNGVASNKDILESVEKIGYKIVKK